MGTTFLVEAENKNNSVIPSYDFGYTAIQMANFWNWLHSEETQYSIEFIEYSNNLVNKFKEFPNAIPIGSVEFTLDWFKSIGIDNVKPLNIPKELWKFCDREIKVDTIKNNSGFYMIKDTDKIKSDINGRLEIRNSEIFINDVPVNLDDKEYFLSEWLNDVNSEWRVFVYNGDIKDIRCYSGDFWSFPDREYIEKIVDEYKNPSYTLDVMVTPNKTEIVELHDFFSCGLYGFEDTILPLMWKRAISNIVGRYTGKII